MRAESTAEESDDGPGSAGVSVGDNAESVPSPRPVEKFNVRSVALQMPRIGRNLYISGYGGLNNIKMLQQQEITHVLILARELESTVLPDFVNVRFVGLRDAENEDILTWLPELVEHVHQVISSGGRIVVCCVAGVSRSASICLAYKVRHEGLSLREAFDEVVEIRPVISPNMGFWRALVQWEWEVRGENSVLMRPYICGMTPELDCYNQYTETRVRLGWMTEMLTMWAFHFLLLLLQVIAIIWI